MRPVPQPIGTRYGVPGKMWSCGHHTGVDFLAPPGTPVHAIAAGKVIHASYGGGWGAAYGLHVVVESVLGGRTRQVLYAHLDARMVKEGATVKVGQLLGKSGSTGNVSGPHLHLEVRAAPYRYGDDIDPMPYVDPAPAAKPAKAPKAAPGAWGRFLHLARYALSDSARGLRKGRRRAKPYTAADLDTHMTSDHVWACVHWGDLREHTVNRHLRGGKVSRTPWRLVKLARTPDGLRVRNLFDLLATAKGLGYTRIEVEPKDVPTLEDFRALEFFADRVGIRVIVKRLTSIPGAAECLANAHAAGLETMVLPRGTRVLSQATYWPVTDYVRGPVHWK